MIIGSWNVNSVRARIENIKEYLNKFSPDILMMQEIKTPDETYPYNDIKSLKYENYVFGQKSYNGVAIISKKKLDNIEKDIFNATETYRRASNGTIETTFTFTKGGFSGPRKTYRPTGFIDNTDTNAVWGMQFIWPIKADFRIVYLDENYQRTVIAREKRDYVWLMARDPILSAEEYAGFVQFIVSLGYSENQLRRVPQKWTDTSLN